MKLFKILFITFFLFSHGAYSDEKAKNDVECEKGSEFTWNPSSADTSAKLKRFYKLDKLMTEKFKQSDFASAKKLAEEYLALADVYKKNWNYGNAIHDANRILGLISYQKGNYDEAASYLIKAGKSTGSPQLDTFGPELDLANLLLQKGKRAEVKTYLLDIKSFWKMDHGNLDGWIESIEQNETPELTRFANIRVSIYEQIFYWIILVWPIVVSLVIFFRYKRKKLSPAKFFPASIVTGYIISILGSILLGLLIGYSLAFLVKFPESYTAALIYTITGILQLGAPLWAIYFLSGLSKLQRVNN